MVWNNYRRELLLIISETRQVSLSRRFKTWRPDCFAWVLDRSVVVTIVCLLVLVQPGGSIFACACTTSSNTEAPLIRISEKWGASGESIAHTPCSISVDGEGNWSTSTSNFGMQESSATLGVSIFWLHGCNLRRSCSRWSSWRQHKCKQQDKILIRFNTRTCTNKHTYDRAHLSKWNNSVTSQHRGDIVFGNTFDLARWYKLSKNKWWHDGNNKQPTIKTKNCTHMFIDRCSMLCKKAAPFKLFKDNNMYFICF